ncbi:MAG: DNA primase [Ruminococcaceae bacterium]|nr:DNA primase [Oscillospiraceae bacterium]
MISKQQIDEIKYRNDIEDVISQYVTLKRAGSNTNGLCPFHSEKTPSFTVYKSSQSFYCFGCGAGGDVITFIMKAENLDYRDALEFLAKRAGITLLENERDKEEGVRRTRVLEMNREAAKFFHENLKNNPDALKYAASRGLDGATVKHFGIGYAPESFGALTDHMHKLGYTDEELKTAFLAGISQKTGRAYDYFRKRLMFPIINTSGEVIAFGGRITDNTKPKYINTSDTPAFKKSKNLFALNFARSYCAQEMILCEGYMDVVALHAAGFQNAVATLGTALTSEQARLLKKYTKRVIISYDSDEAGQAAADRAFTLLGEAGLETRILRMEGAKDPDEYIKKFGKEAFRKLIEGGVTRFDYKFDVIIKENDIATTEGRIKAASLAALEISKTPSNVEREIYINKAADKLKISADSLKRDVNKIISSRSRKNQKEQTQKIILDTQGYADRVNPDRIKNLKANSAEEMILGIMLRFHEYITGVNSGKFNLSADDFVSEFSKRVFVAITEGAEDFDIGMLNEKFTEAEMARIVKMQIAREGLTVSDKIFADSIDTLKDAGKKETLSIADIINKKRNQFNNKS